MPALAALLTDQCVVYLKTRVYSPREQKVRLEIGSDDGIKLWINGKLVHAKNAMRPLQPGEDTAEAVLKEGGSVPRLAETPHSGEIAALHCLPQAVTASRLPERNLAAVA